MLKIGINLIAVACYLINLPCMEANADFGILKRREGGEVRLFSKIFAMRNFTIY